MYYVLVLVCGQVNVVCGWVAVGGGRGACACVQLISDVCVCVCVCTSQTYCTLQMLSFSDTGLP